MIDVEEFLLMEQLHERKEKEVGHYTLGPFFKLKGRPYQDLKNSGILNEVKHYINKGII